VSYSSFIVMIFFKNGNTRIRLHQIFGDASVSVLARAMLPEITRRMWAQVRAETVSFDAQGQPQLSPRGDSCDRLQQVETTPRVGATYSFADHRPLL
jgi:hypothetical protein